MKTKHRVGIIDYGMGNLQSVANACEYLGFEAQILNHPEMLQTHDRVILPGVGAFAQGSRNLKAAGWDGAIREFVRAGEGSLLGICLGMQLFADEGAEGGAASGLGLISGRVARLPEKGLRIPHIGWNDARVQRPDSLFEPDSADDFYFVHSYYFDAGNQADVAATCEYGIRFACAVHKGKVAGVQFHPEKSQESGLRILKNFLERGC